MVLCDTVSDLKELWQLDPSFTFLNHGSFGATPKSILAEQYRLHLHIESQPVRFYQREIESMLDASREKLATLLGVDAEGVVFVPNATTGVNAVLRSLRFAPGEEILITDHEYNACRNAAEFVAKRDGATVRVVDVPLAGVTPQRVKDLVLGAVTKKTRLLMIDHVTSPTALIFPVQEIIDGLDGTGVEVLVDGAHAPGMVPLDLTTLGAHYYTGNCHKWLCSPKGAAFLYVREDKRPQVRPVTISHGANSRRTDRTIFRQEFDWTGTGDYSPYIMVGKSIEFVESLYRGGISELMSINHKKVLEAGKALCERFDVPWEVPPEMIGSMASLPILPLEDEPAPANRRFDPIQDRLYHQYGVEVPIISWPSSGHRLVRISRQAYNTEADYERLGDAVAEILSVSRH